MSNLILLNLDRESTVPLFRQIFGQIKQLIDNNTLEPGFRMPSTRELAERHGLNRSTVYKAYEELWAMGYMESRPGSYSVVRKRQKMAANDSRTQQGLIPWETKASIPGNALHRAYERLKNPVLTKKVPAHTFNLASLELDHRLFPVDEFRKCINTVMIEQGAELLRYGDCEGYRPLREYIAQRLRIHGIAVEYKEILVTNGSQNGIELILKLLTTPGTPVAVEAPTYSNVLPLLEYFQTDTIGIPMNNNGMNLDILEKTFNTKKPAFVYTIPNFHNPTGITTDQAHREKLLALCEEYRIPIIEDAFEEEMKYFGKVPLPIKSMDRQKLVLYVGTFSKILFPGIRIGWIAADRESIDRLNSIKKFSDLSTNSLLQAALWEFCREGFYDRHIKRMHREYRKRMHTATSTLKSSLECFKKVSWTEPAGGYLIWLKLQDTRMDEEQLREVFFRHGAAVAPGRYFYPGIENKTNLSGNESFHLRLSISVLNEYEIREGISRLTTALEEIYWKRHTG